jgi:hypothetical protein
VESCTIEADGEFADGGWKGSLYFSDTDHQLTRPLTSEAIYDFEKDNLFDPEGNPSMECLFCVSVDYGLRENNPAFCLPVSSFLNRQSRPKRYL